MSSIGRKLVSSLGFVYKGSSSPSRYSLITHQTYSTHPASTSTNTATPTQIPSNNNNNPSQNTNNKPPQNAKMITGPLNEMLARNSKFAQTYQAPPSLPQMVAGMRASGAGVVVISCSDPRLNPYQILGIDPTLKATMVRNAGGRVMDAIRTLTALQTIGDPKTIVVMHHTDCGMTHYHDSAIREALTEIAPAEKEKIGGMKFGEILDVEESIREDLEILRNEPLIKKTTQLVGLKLDIMTGVLTVVE